MSAAVSGSPSDQVDALADVEGPGQAVLGGLPRLASAGAGDMSSME